MLIPWNPIHIGGHNNFCPPPNLGSIGLYSIHLAISRSQVKPYGSQYPRVPMFSKYTVGEDTYGDLSVPPSLIKNRVTLLEWGITQHKSPRTEDYFCKSFPVIPTQHIMRNHGYHRKNKGGVFSQKQNLTTFHGGNFLFIMCPSKYTKNFVWVQYARRERERHGHVW